EEAAIDEEMAFDTCERNGIAVAGELAHAILVRVKGQSGALPSAPGLGSRELDAPVLVRQPLVVGPYHVRALLGRNDALVGLESVRIDPAAALLVEPVDLALAEQKYAAEDQLGDPLGVLFGVGQ